jgi:proline iminopeptidase
MSVGESRIVAGPMNVVVDGAELFVECVGEGTPMLMMHGVGLDHEYLRPWHDALPAEVIYYDHRCNGRSSRGGAADHATWCADAAALLEHLGHDRAVIFGHSYGAWLALGFALRYPQRVSGLVLCAASPAFDYVDSVIATAQVRDPEAAAKLLAGFSHLPETDDGLRQLWLDILPLYFMGTPRPEILAKTRFSARGFALGMRCLEGFSTASELPTIRVPTLVVTGVHDYITPPSQGRRIADAVRRARYVELDASGHFPFVEQPAEYTAAVASWLASEPMKS